METPTSIDANGSADVADPTLSLRYLGLAIRAERRRREITLAQLSAATRISQGQLSRIESGQVRTMSEQSLATIAMALNCSPEELRHAAARRTVDEAERPLTGAEAEVVRRIVQELKHELAAQLDQRFTELTDTLRAEMRAELAGPRGIVRAID